MWQGLFAVGTGAVLGAWLRWGLQVWLNPAHAALSAGTLAANLIGGFGAGLALGWVMQQPGLAPEWRLFVTVGLLGGLTTFSTFSAEVVALLLRQQYGWASLVIALHLAGSIAATLLGVGAWRLLQPAA